MGLGTAATQASGAFAAASHSHVIADVTGLQTAIDGKQPLDATLTALAGVTTSANKIIYSTAADTFTTADLSAYGRSLIDDADAATARTTLGLGTAATQASSAFQAADATLTALAGVTTSANKLIYSTAADTFTTADLSAYGRSLIDDADAATARTTLGLGTAATQASSAFQAADATLTALAGVTTSANKLIYATAADTFTTADLSAYGRSLIDDADAATARTTLGLGTAATQASGAFAAASHSHVIADVTGLQAAIDGKAAVSHSHAIADVTGLQTALDDLAADVGGRLIGVQVFTASGTYNKNASAAYSLSRFLALGRCRQRGPVRPARSTPVAPVPVAVMPGRRSWRPLSGRRRR
ncbi:MAG: hypothetical protein IPK59_10225 [Rhodospirillaceae bacterium]|nr:hypothetical protein [Rhodospirillaceae bacterium]